MMQQQKGHDVCKRQARERAERILLLDVCWFRVVEADNKDNVLVEESI